MKTSVLPIHPILILLLLFTCCQEEGLVVSDSKRSVSSGKTTRSKADVVSAKKFYFKTAVVSRINFDLRAFRSGQITIDWGDGQKQKVRLLGIENQNWLDHLYASPGEYQVSISGNMKNIFAFITNPPIKNIYTNSLSSLEGLLVTYSYVPLYDLSNNTKLQQIGIRALSDHTVFIMPSSHDISYASFNDSSIKNIDEVISNIYQNAVTKDIFDGALYLQNIRQHYPSSESLQKLFILRDDYYWDIRLDPL